jgi:hypothetical protein
MDSLLFSMKILIVEGYHSRVYVYSIMDNFITHLLCVSMDMATDIHSATCKMGDQQMLGITLSSNQMGAHNM